MITAVERHQNLIERADGEYYQGQNEAKFGGGRDSPDNLHVIPHLAPYQILETQTNLEEPEGERDNRMLEAGMQIDKTKCKNVEFPSHHVTQWNKNHRSAEEMITAI